MHLITFNWNIRLLLVFKWTSFSMGAKILLPNESFKVKHEILLKYSIKQTIDGKWTSSLALLVILTWKVTYVLFLFPIYFCFYLLRWNSRLFIRHTYFVWDWKAPFELNPLMPGGNKKITRTHVHTR